MFIGNLLQDRLNLFGMSVEQFSDDIMMDSELVQGIISNEISLNDIDAFDLQVISNALYCEPEYFFDLDARNNDVVFCSSNRGDDTACSNLAKAKLQQFVRDVLFLKEAI